MSDESLRQCEGTDEEIAEDSTDSSSDEDPGAGFKWREDVLLRVMEANGIDKSNRDDFVRHAVNFDDDDNNYLKKAEIEAAAAAWVESQSPAEEDSTKAKDETPEESEAADGEKEESVAEDSGTAEEEVETEEPTEEDAEQEGQKKTSSDLTDSIVCPICSTSNPAGSVTCASGGFAF